MKITDEQLKRFWAKVDKKTESECWEWIAGKNSRGYGNFKLNGKTVTASRISWSLLNGEIFSDIFVCHSCDNPSCVNPSHLFVSDNQGNVDDMIGKKRHRNQVKTHCGTCSREYSIENTYHRSSGHRVCKYCSNKASNEYHKNNRNKINIRRRDKYKTTND